MVRDDINASIQAEEERVEVEKQKVLQDDIEELNFMRTQKELFEEQRNQATSSVSSVDLRNTVGIDEELLLH